MFFWNRFIIEFTFLDNPVYVIIELMLIFFYNVHFLMTSLQIRNENIEILISDNCAIYL